MDEVKEIPGQTVPVRVIEVELKLMRWGENSDTGCRLTFEVVYPHELEPFKIMQLGKTKGAQGQRFMAALALIHDDETKAKA